MSEETPKERPKKQPKPISKLDMMIQQATSGGTTLGREDDPAKERCPVIWEWLTRTECGVKDGYQIVKTPATIRITAAPEGWIITITDVDMAKSMDAVTGHLDGFLDALEAAITSAVSPIKRFGRKDPSPRRRKTNF